METRLKSPKREKPGLSLEGRTQDLELDLVAEAVTTLLDSLGTFIEALGRVESKHPGLVERIRNLGSNPDMLRNFIESMPAEVVSEILKILLRLMSISPELNNLNTIPAQRKIEIGKELRAISQEMTRLRSQAGRDQ